MPPHNKAVFLAALLLCTGLRSQSIRFDYQREELPAMSLNRLSYFDAKLLRYSGNPLMADSLLSCLVNPAANPTERQIVLTLSSKTHSAFQFWGINEGLLGTNRAVSEQNIDFCAGALGFSASGMAIAAGFAETAIRAFPSFTYENSQTDQSDTIRYRYEGLFSGPENTFFFSLRKDISRKFHAGITLSYMKTVRTVSLSEHLDHKPGDAPDWIVIRTLLQQEHHNLKAFSLIAGISHHPNRFLHYAVSASLSAFGRAEREIIRELTVPRDSRSFRTGSRDSIREPLRVTASLMAVMPIKSSRFTLQSGLNMVFTHWSGYRFLFFDRDLSEGMRNTLSASISLAARFKTGLGIFEIGGSVLHDPQPLKNPATALLQWSGGISLRDKWLEVDLTLAHLAARMDWIEIPHTLLSCTGRFRF